MTWATVFIRESSSSNHKPREMKQVLARKPQKERPFKCSRCDLEFRSRHNRQRHGKREHSGAAPVVVEYQIQESEFRVVRPKKVAIVEKAEDAKTQEQGKPETQEKGRPQTQERGNSETLKKDKPETQKKGSSETQKKAEPKTQKKGKPGTLEKGKPESQKKAEPKTQKKGEPKTQEKSRLDEPKKSPVSPKTERRIPREVKKDSFEVLEKRRKMYLNRNHDKEEDGLKATAESAISVANSVRIEKNPEQSRRRKSNNKRPQLYKQRDDAQLWNLRGRSVEAMASLECV